MPAPQQNTRVDPLANYLPVNLHEAETLVMDTFRAGWVPNLLSSPGIGKSSLIKQIAKKANLCVLDVRLSQLDPADLNGFPTITTDENGVKRAGYIPMNIFPIKGDSLPINPETGVTYAGWILFLDELNAATPAVQAAAYKILLDRMIGMHELHPKCLVASAGNLKTDKAIVNFQSTATQSRIAHLVIKVCNETWHWWANANNVDVRVKAFLKWKPDSLHKFDPNHQDLTFACPRTWEMTSDVIKPMKECVESSKLPLLAGCIGLGSAREFYAFTEVFADLPTIQKIISDPQGITIRDEPSVHYALAGLVGHHMKVANSAALLKFIMRLGPDFQVVSLRQAVANDMDLLKSPAIAEWVKYNTEALIRSR